MRVAAHDLLWGKWQARHFAEPTNAAPGTAGLATAAAPLGADLDDGDPPGRDAAAPGAAGAATSVPIAAAIAHPPAIEAPLVMRTPATADLPRNAASYIRKSAAAIPPAPG
jgi:hypothetical protein